MSEQEEKDKLDRRLRAIESFQDNAEEKLGKILVALDELKNIKAENEEALGEVRKVLGLQHDEIVRAKAAFAGLANEVQSLMDATNAQQAPPFSYINGRDPEERRNKEAELDLWVNDDLAFFPDGILIDCWRLHVEIIEELLVLMEGRKAFWSGDPKVRPADRFDWLNRWRPETLKRIKAVKCSGLADPLHTGYVDEAHTEPAPWVPVAQVGMGRFEGEHFAEYRGMYRPPAPSGQAVAESLARRKVYSDKTFNQGQGTHGYGFEEADFTR